MRNLREASCTTAYFDGRQKKRALMIGLDSSSCARNHTCRNRLGAGADRGKRVWERLCGVGLCLIGSRCCPTSRCESAEVDARSSVLSVRLGTRHAKPAEHALSLSSAQGARQNWAVRVQAGSEEARRAGSETGRQCCSP